MAIPKRSLDLAEWMEARPGWYVRIIDIPDEVWDDDAMAYLEFEGMVRTASLDSPEQNPRTCFWHISCPTEDGTWGTCREKLKSDPDAQQRFLARLEPKGRQALVAARIEAQAGADKSPDETAATIDTDELGILRALAKAKPVLQVMSNLENETRISRKTVGAKLTRLIDKGLVHRPGGPRDGVAITTKGQDVLSQCDSNITP